MNKTIKDIIKTVNSKDFKNTVSALGVIYWAIRQFNAPRCSDCNQNLLFIGIEYYCINCGKIPLRH